MAGHIHVTPLPMDLCGILRQNRLLVENLARLCHCLSSAAYSMVRSCLRLTGNMSAFVLSAACWPIGQHVALVLACNEDQHRCLLCSGIKHCSSVVTCLVPLGQPHLYLPTIDRFSDRPRNMNFAADTFSFLEQDFFVILYRGTKRLLCTQGTVVPEIMLW